MPYTLEDNGRTYAVEKNKFPICAKNCDLFLLLFLPALVLLDGCGLKVYNLGSSATTIQVSASIVNTLILSGPSFASGAACAGPITITNQDGLGNA